MSDPKNPDHNESDFFDMDLEHSDTSSASGSKLEMDEGVIPDKQNDAQAQNTEYEPLFSPGDFVSHHETPASDSGVVKEPQEADDFGPVVEDVAEEIVASADENSDVYDVVSDYPSTSDDTLDQADDAHDGDDWDEDFDDEEGIFAETPSEEKKKSSFGILLVSAAALAIVGAGGYFYLNDPDMVQRIQKNFSGESSADNSAGNNVLLPNFDLNEQGNADAPQSGPVANVPPPAQQDSVDIFGGDMPPQPPVSSSSASLSDGASVSGAVDVASADVPAAPEMMQDAQPAPLMGEGGGDASSLGIPPDASEGVADVQSVDDVSQTGEVSVPASGPVPASEGEMLPSVPPAAAMAAESVPASSPVPVAAMPSDAGKVKLVDDISAKVPDSGSLSAVAQNNEATVESESMSGQIAEKDVAAENKEQVYYDAPGGSILTALPAPSLDVKRGNNESIIIVNSSAKPQPKPSVKPKYHDAKGSSGKVEFGTTSLDARVVAAGRALKLGRYDAAAEMYEDLYKLNPRDPRILMGRAILFQKTGDDRAASAYEELLQVDPGNADAIVNLAGLIRKDYPAVALGKLLDLRQRYPDNPAVAAQLGVAYADSGNLPDAYRYLSLAAAMEPNNPLHYFNMAVIADRAHEAPKAIAMYEKALEVDAVHGTGRTIPRGKIYDRLAQLRGR